MVKLGVMDADSELMLQVKKGEVAAFNQILERYQRPIINFVFRLVGRREEAEEIGKIMNLSLAAVKFLLHRAKENLKEKLAKLF